MRAKMHSKTKAVRALPQPCIAAGSGVLALPKSYVLVYMAAKHTSRNR